MKEPERDYDLSHLVDYVGDRVVKLCRAMKGRGFDPQIWETRRSRKRQAWLYGQGRTRLQCIRALISPFWAQPAKPIVTKTMASKHLAGKACDIVSYTTKWSDPAFFVALREEAERFGLHTLGFEGCHIEWRG